MQNMMKSLYSIRFLDELAQKNTVISRVHPLVKLIVTAFYLIVVVSCSKYDIGILLPLMLYPVITISLADVPVVPILKRSIIAAPLAIGIGILNPVFDYKTMAVIGGMHISGGWVSFISILIKCLLTVTAAIILIATTEIAKIGAALRILRVPKIFVMQLLLTYRYISVLIEEAARTTRAYSLRSPFKSGIEFKHFGSLLGQLLLRTVDRAQRIYQSMCCRGFEGEYNTGNIGKATFKDLIYLTVWIVFFMLARNFNIPALIGMLVAGGLK